MKWGRAEHPSLPPPPNRHSFDIQHKAQAVPVRQQGCGKHELAGEQHTLHLLGEPAGAEMLLASRPWLSAVLPGMMSIICTSQEGLKTYAKAKSSWKSRLLWLQDSPAATWRGSSPLPEQALPGALCFAFLPPGPSWVKTPLPFLRACCSLVDGFSWESKATKKLAGNK